MCLTILIHVCDVTDLYVHAADVRGQTATQTALTSSASLACFNRRSYFQLGRCLSTNSNSNILVVYYDYEQTRQGRSRVISSLLTLLLMRGWSWALLRINGTKYMIQSQHLRMFGPKLIRPLIQQINHAKRYPKTSANQKRVRISSALDRAFPGLFRPLL